MVLEEGAVLLRDVDNTQVTDSIERLKGLNELKSIRAYKNTYIPPRADALSERKKAGLHRGARLSVSNTTTPHHRRSRRPLT